MSSVKGENPQSLGIPRCSIGMYSDASSTLSRILRREERRVGSSLSPLETRSIRSTGLGILPIGSVGIVIGGGLAHIYRLAQSKRP